MCYFSELFRHLYIRHQYDEIEINEQDITTFQSAMNIILANEPNLILSYSQNGMIKFSKRWRKWYDNLKCAKEFMSKHLPLDIKDTLGENSDIYQEVFITIIPIKDHSQFFQVILKEYCLTDLKI
jgi:hypothetical protein